MRFNGIQPYRIEPELSYPEDQVNSGQDNASDMVSLPPTYLAIELLLESQNGVIVVNVVTFQYKRSAFLHRNKHRKNFNVVDL